MLLYCLIKIDEDGKEKQNVFQSGHRFLQFIYKSKCLIKLNIAWCHHFISFFFKKNTKIFQYFSFWK